MRVKSERTRWYLAPVDISLWHVGFSAKYEGSVIESTLLEVPVDQVVDLITAYTHLQMSPV